MICPRCKYQIFDGLLCCPVCGADLSSAEPAAEEAVPTAGADTADGAPAPEYPVRDLQDVNPYLPPQQTEYPYQPTQPVYPPQPQQPAYPPQPPYPYQPQQPVYTYQPAAQPVRRNGAPKITRGGRMVSVIFSAAMIAIGIIYVIINSDVFGSSSVFNSPKVFLLISLPALILLFVFSLLMNRLKPVFTGIPLALMTFASFIQGSSNGIYVLAAASAVALFFVTVSLASNPLALRIITSIVFVILICLVSYGFFSGSMWYIEHYKSFYADDIAVSAIYAVIYIMLYITMTVIVLCRRSDDRAPAGAVTQV